MALACVGIFAAGLVWAQEKIKDFYLSNYKDDGKSDWEIKGTEAITHGNNVDITNVNANYFLANDTVNVTSRIGLLDKVKLNVTLKRDVVIHNRAGAKLTTDVLNWQKEQNLIHTASPVTIVRDTMRIDAVGMHGDTLLKTMNFERQVKTTMRDMRGHGDVTITCDGPLEIEYNKGRAIFHHNVVITHDQGKIYADKAVAYFDAAAKSLNRIVCVGKRVHIVKGGDTSYARRVTYLRDKDKVVLEGRPHLIYHPQPREKAF